MILCEEISSGIVELLAVRGQNGEEESPQYFLTTGNGPWRPRLGVAFSKTGKTTP